MAQISILARQSLLIKKLFLFLDKPEPGKIKDTWIDYCNKCKKNHRYTLKPCVCCGTVLVPTPVSETVEGNCLQSRECDGCVEWRGRYY